MPEDVTRTIASVSCSITGSGTGSNRPPRLPRHLNAHLAILLGSSVRMAIPPSANAKPPSLGAAVKWSPAAEWGYAGCEPVERMPAYDGRAGRHGGGRDSEASPSEC